MTPTTKTKVKLPAGIRPTDLKYPSWKSKDGTDSTLGDYGSLTFHRTERFSWCIATLPISNARRGFVDRTYAIDVDNEGIVTVGNGPHVTDTITVYVRKSRVNALKKYTDLYAKGLVNANSIRDRISTRRANTVLRRGSYPSWL